MVNNNGNNITKGGGGTCATVSRNETILFALHYLKTFIIFNTLNKIE